MRSKKQLFVVLSVIVVLIISGIFVVYRYTIADMVFSPHSLPRVDLDAWGQLQKGMTKEDVIALLGDSHSKTSPVITAESNKTSSVDKEYWEYNWTDGLSGVFGPSLRAYVVYFDGQGKVVSFREPVK
ncbi:MAG: outer membrane protein assembly factor BamE [Candidatus Omnitrophica bacterium]|nr:outer membrane protein assembly factor BamE [Candidatus Omnitrophota bacterium]